MSGVRWTAPRTGLYDVSASFADNQAGGDGADVYVYRNKKSLFTGDAGTTVGSGTGYSASGLALKKDDHLDFLVGAGPDAGPTGNNTTLEATIKALPVPKVVGINFRADDATQTIEATDTAGVIPTARWNNIPFATRTASNLVESEGAATTVGLEITGALAAYQFGSTATDDGDRKMMTGHIYLGVGGTIDVKVSGLSPAYTGAGYDLYVYYRSGTGQWKQSFAVLDGTGTAVAGPATVLDSQTIGFDGDYVASDGNGSAGHYYKFAGLHLPSFTLEAVPVAGYAYLSGMQIVQATAAAPSALGIARGADGLKLSWTGAATLQSAGEVTGQWLDIPDAKSPFTVSPSEARRFYRLKP